MVKLNGEKLKRLGSSISQRFSSAKTNIERMKEERERKELEKENREMEKMALKAKLAEANIKKIREIRGARKAISEEKRLRWEERMRMPKQIYQGARRVYGGLDKSFEAEYEIMRYGKKRKKRLKADLKRLERERRERARLEGELNVLELKARLEEAKSRNRGILSPINVRKEPSQPPQQSGLIFGVGQGSLVFTTQDKKKRRPLI